MISQISHWQSEIDNWKCLDVKSEEHDITILNKVFAAFDLHQSVLLHGGFGSEAVEVCEPDDLGPDKPLFEV